MAVPDIHEADFQAGGFRGAQLGGEELREGWDRRSRPCRRWNCRRRIRDDEAFFVRLGEGDQAEEALATAAAGGAPFTQLCVAGLGVGRSRSVLFLGESD
jgi:hypothetical protein